MPYRAFQFQRCKVTFLTLIGINDEWDALEAVVCKFNNFYFYAQLVNRLAHFFFFMTFFVDNSLACG